MNAVITAVPAIDAHAGLGFMAASVTVDNHTNQWLWLPAAGRYVPPWQYGASFALASTTTQADIEFQQPPGQPQATVDTSQAVQTIWSSEARSSALGISMPPAGGGSVSPLAPQAISLGSLGSAFPVSNRSITAQIPQGAYAVQVVGTYTGTGTTQITVTGRKSGIVYAQRSYPAGPVNLTVPIDPVDTGATGVSFVNVPNAGISIAAIGTNNAGNSSTLQAAVLMYPTSGNQGGVGVVINSGGSLIGQQLMGASLPVAIASDQSAVTIQGEASGIPVPVIIAPPTGGKVVSFLRYAGVVAGSTTATLYTAPAGGSQVNRITAEVDASAATQFTLKIAGTSIADFPCIAGVFRNFECGAVSMTVGQLIEITNETGTSGTVRGMICTNE